MGKIDMDKKPSNWPLLAVLGIVVLLGLVIFFGRWQRDPVFWPLFVLSYSPVFILGGVLVCLVLLGRRLVPAIGWLWTPFVLLLASGWVLLVLPLGYWVDGAATTAGDTRYRAALRGGWNPRFGFVRHEVEVYRCDGWRCTYEFGRGAGGTRFPEWGRVALTFLPHRDELALHVNDGLRYVETEVTGETQPLSLPDDLPAIRPDNADSLQPLADAYLIATDSVAFVGDTLAINVYPRVWTDEHGLLMLGLDPYRRVSLLPVAGEDYRIFGLAWSADGERIIARDNEGQVLLLGRGGQHEVIAENVASKAALSPDGTRVAYANEEQLIVRNLDTGAVRTANLVDQSIFDMVFSPDGTQLLTDERTLWSVDDLEQVSEVHNLRSQFIAFTPDGSTVIGSNHRGVQAFSLAENAVLWETERPDERIQSMTLSADGTVIATGHDDGTLALWDAADGTRLHAERGHRNDIFGMAFSPDGTLLVTSGRDSVVRVWGAVLE